MPSTDQNRYYLLFEGELLAGKRRDQVLTQLSHLTNLDTTELLDALFAVKPVILHGTSDSELAQRYLEAFTNAGLKLRLESGDFDAEDILDVDLRFSHYAPLQRVETAPNFLVDTDRIEAQAQKSPPAKPELSDAGADCYQLLFEGELQQGTDKQRTIVNLAQLTKSDVAAVTEQFFSVVPVLLASASKPDALAEYQTAFSQAGLKLAVLKAPLRPDAFTSQLRPRQDRPDPPAPAKPRTFTYALGALCLLAAVFWSLIYISYQSLFREQPARTLEVQISGLPAPAIAEPVLTEPAFTEPAITEIEEPAPPSEQPAVESAAPLATLEEPPSATAALPIATAEEQPPQTLIAEQPRTPTPTPPPASTPQRAQPQLNAAQLKQIQDNYFVQLLNWFANAEYENAEATRNLEGEIQVEIEIDRAGNLIAARVLASSSQRLTDLTLAAAERASPYPAVPEAISGGSYSFILPLRYQLETD